MKCTVGFHHRATFAFVRTLNSLDVTLYAVRVYDIVWMYAGRQSTAAEHRPTLVRLHSAELTANSFPTQKHDYEKCRASMPNANRNLCKQ